MPQMQRATLRRTAAMLTPPCLIAGMVSCAGAPPAPVDYTPPRALEAPKPYSNRDRPVTTMIPSAQSRANAAAAQGRLIDRLQFQAPMSTIDRARGGVSQATSAEQRVKLAFNKADARDVIRIITTEYLGRGFIIDPSINDDITMDVDQQMSIADVADLLAALARIYGWSIQDVAGVLHVSKIDAQTARSPVAPILTDRVVSPSEQPIIRVRRFTYVDPSTVESLLSPFMSADSQRIAQGRLLIMIDTQSQIARAEQLLDILDVAPFTNVQLLRYRLENIDASAATELLLDLSQQTGIASGPANEPSVSFVQMPNSQDLFVLLRDPSLASATADLIAQVDAPRATGQRLRYIYNVQHYDTGRLRQLIAEFYSGSIESPSPGGVSDDEPRLPPNSDRMRLSWDDQNDTLLVLATPEDYADLLSTLRVIDRPPQQVSISAVIAEVGLDDTLEYGVEYFLEGLDIDGFGTLDFNASTGAISGSPTGSAFFAGASGFAIVQALDSEADVEIISQPHVTVVDGGTARIQVGLVVPVIRAAEESETGRFNQDIEPQDTGTILDLQVEINESGNVTITITSEVSAVGLRTELGPEFIKRQINSEVVVPHGRTLVLGGIINTSDSTSVAKIPLLGDIPVLGNAFRSQRDEDDRTELLLTITPTIINDPSEVQAHTSEFISSVRAVQDALHRVSDELPVGMLRPANTFPDSQQFIDSGAPIGTVEPFQLGAEQRSEAVPNSQPVQQDPPQMPPFMEELLRSVENQNAESSREN